MSRSIISAISLALVVVGCNDGAVAPVADATPLPNAELAASSRGQAQRGFAAYGVSLSAAPGSSSTAVGRLRVFVGLPPNPVAPPNPICETAPTGTYVIVCGVIQNPDADSILSGTLTLQWTRTGQALVLNFAVPPNPICPRYAVSAVASVQYPAPGPPGVQVAFQTDKGEIVGIGAPSPGPPERTAGSTTGNPGARSARVCQITFAAR